jgi:two-component system response regulator AtoC
VTNLATESLRILLVSAEPSGWDSLRTIAEGKAWRLEGASSGWEALERLQSGTAPELVLLDVTQQGGDGLHTLRWLRRVSPGVRVVVFADGEDGGQKLEAIRLGAQGFVIRNGDGQQFAQAIEQHLAASNCDPDRDMTGQGIEEIGQNLFFVAASPVMQKLKAQAELLARVDAPLLIMGESGSGQEITARLIHKLSVRSEFHFLKVDCSAFPGDLLDSELFGSESAANGSDRSKPGKFEIGDRGTVFLEEISEMTPERQTKLLNAIQNRYFIRRGGGEKIPMNVRIMASTCANIKEALAEGRLREDLYYRLSAFSLYVPPVCHRQEEIPLLMGHFMKQLAQHYSLPARVFSAAMLERCRGYAWPGNLIELESFVKRYLVVGDEELAMRELERNISSLAGQGLPGHQGELVYRTRLAALQSEDASSGLKSFVENVKGEAEKNAINTALEQTNWNRKAAARLLKVSYRTLLYKIQQYQMNPRRSYVSAAWLEDRGKSHRDPG